MRVEKNSKEESEKIMNHVIKGVDKIKEEAAVKTEGLSSYRLLGLIKEYVELEFNARTMSDKEKVEKLLTAFIAIGQVANCEKKE